MKKLDRVLFVRCRGDLLDRLREVADGEGRSVAGAARHLLVVELRRRGVLPRQQEVK